MTLELKIDLLLQEINLAEAELNLKYKRLSILRAELDRHRHDTNHPDFVATASD